MSTTVVTTTTTGGQMKVVVTVDGKAVVELGPGSDAEEGVPPTGGQRAAEEKQFLIENYPKNLEDIKVEWLSALLRQTVSQMVRQPSRSTSPALHAGGGRESRKAGGGMSTRVSWGHAHLAYRSRRHYCADLL